MQETDLIHPQAFRFYRRLERLHGYAQANISEGISLADAASAVGMEATAFCHFFRRATGTNFKGWITAPDRPGKGTFPRAK